jgi:hypothetical protein
MLHSLLVVFTLFTFCITNHFFDPSSIRAIPVDLVTVLLKKCPQAAIFDPPIAAQLQPPLPDPSAHNRRADMQFAAQFPLTVVGLIARPKAFFPNLAPHGVLGTAKLARDCWYWKMANRLHEEISVGLGPRETLAPRFARHAQFMCTADDRCSRPAGLSANFRYCGAETDNGRAGQQLLLQFIGPLVFQSLFSLSEYLFTKSSNARPNRFDP